MLTAPLSLFSSRKTETIIFILVSCGMACSRANNSWFCLQTQKMLNEATLSDHHKMMWKTNSDGQVFTKEQCKEEDGND